jgi:hypothetical protein
MEVIKRIARLKVYVDRSRWYFVLIQFLMIVIMFIESKGFELEFWHYPLIIIGVLFLLVVAGYLDRVSGMIKAEQQFYADENPFFQEMMRKLK